MGSIGAYGIVKPAKVNIEDIEVWYQYRPNRNEFDENFLTYKKLPSNNVLEEAEMEDSNTASRGVETKLYGLYNLKLPLTNFNKPGIYSIYLKPKEIFGKILDSDAVLSAFPDIRGIVIKTTDIDTTDTTMFSNNNLIGYRLEYFNNNGEREEFFRIVTSNGFVEPINENLSDGNQKSIRYRYNDNSDLVYITLTPSSSISNRPNLHPFIGSIDQTISFTNTNFNPIMLEVELVENDAETLAMLISGDQTHSLEDGIITTYDDSHEIVKQVEVSQLKDSYTNKPVFNVRRSLGSDIDKTKEWSNIVED